MGVGRCFQRFISSSFDDTWSLSATSVAVAVVAAVVAAAVAAVAGPSKLLPLSSPVALHSSSLPLLLLPSLSPLICLPASLTMAALVAACSSSPRDRNALRNGEGLLLVLPSMEDDETDEEAEGERSGEDGEDEPDAAAAGAAGEDGKEEEEEEEVEDEEEDEAEAAEEVGDDGEGAELNLNPAGPSLCLCSSEDAAPPFPPLPPFPLFAPPPQLVLQLLFDAEEVEAADMATVMGIKDVPTDKRMCAWREWTLGWIFQEEKRGKGTSGLDTARELKRFREESCDRRVKSALRQDDNGAADVGGCVRILRRGRWYGAEGEAM
ncbi:unnamed protein product [Closterium sp. NIES-53]